MGSTKITLIVSCYLWGGASTWKLQVCSSTAELVSPNAIPVVAWVSEYSCHVLNFKVKASKRVETLSVFVDGLKYLQCSLPEHISFQTTHKVGVLGSWYRQRLRCTCKRDHRSPGFPEKLGTPGMYFAPLLLFQSTLYKLNSRYIWVTWQSVMLSVSFKWSAIVIL